METKFFSLWNYVENEEKGEIIKEAYKIAHIDDARQLVEVKSGKGSHGVYKDNGELLIPAEYVWIAYYDNLMVGTQCGGWKDIYTYDGKFLVRVQEAKKIIDTKVLIIVCFEDEWAFYDFSGKLVATSKNIKGMTFETGISFDNSAGLNVYDKSGRKIEIKKCEGILVHNDFIAVKNMGIWEILCQR